MIRRKHRFNGLGSLRFVYSRGRTVRGPLFSIKSVKNSQRQEYRAAIVVSRKIHKSAVKRNRIRRRLYELIRGLDRDITEPYDVVVTVFSDRVLEASVIELNRQLKRQLQESGVIK